MHGILPLGLGCCFWFWFTRLWFRLLSVIRLLFLHMASSNIECVAIRTVPVANSKGKKPPRLHRVISAERVKKKNNLFLRCWICHNSPAPAIINIMLFVFQSPVFNKLRCNLLSAAHARHQTIQHAIYISHNSPRNVIIAVPMLLRSISFRCGWLSYCGSVCLIECSRATHKYFCFVNN